MKKPLRWTYALLALAAAGCASTHVGTSRSADATFQHDSEYYLASDALEGRGPGTRGQLYAADYIAKQFKDAGLVPVPGHGYFQPWEYVRGWKISPNTALRIGDAIVPMDDGFRPNGLSSTGDFTGQAVFAGYGVSSAEYKYDDLANVDLKGKVVVLLRYEPRDAEGHSRFTKSEEWSPESQLFRKFLNVQNKGAAAIVMVNPPGIEDSLAPYGSAGGRRAGPIRIPVVQVTRPQADKLLGDVSSLASAIDASGKPASKALGVTISGKVELARNALAVRNVIGMIPGEGPHADEYVVVGSHYDHVGWGGPESMAGPSLHAIHHGADDNASGTTAMMTLARRYASSGKRPPRTMIFMAFVCEEQGLLGSAYWCNHPTVPLDHVAYMLNLDMLGRMKNHTLVHGGEGTSPILGGVLAKAYQGEGLKEKTVGASGMGRSDHESFARKKIPVLFLFTGLHPDYHRPSDTADKINYAGLLAATDVANKIADQFLVAPRTPYDASHDDEPTDFGDADANPGPLLKSTSRPAREPVGLGLRPDETQHDYKGIHIDGVTKGRGADKAGIKEGDTLLELDHTRVDSVQDLQEVYDRHKNGDKVIAKLLRAGKTLELEVTFAARNPGT